MDDRSHVIYKCSECGNKVTVTSDYPQNEDVHLCHCTDEYPRMNIVEGKMKP